MLVIICCIFLHILIVNLDKIIARTQSKQNWNTYNKPLSHFFPTVLTKFIILTSNRFFLVLVVFEFISQAKSYVDKEVNQVFVERVYLALQVKSSGLGRCHYLTFSTRYLGLKPRSCVALLGYNLQF